MSINPNLQLPPFPTTLSPEEEARAKELKKKKSQMEQAYQTSTEAWPKLLRLLGWQDR